MKKIGLVVGLALAVILLVLPAPKTEVEAPGTPAAADLVAPATLSDWILSAGQDYMLIDVRPEEAYLDDAIKTAVSLPAGTLDGRTIGGLPEHRTLVLYADDTDGAVAAWQAVKPFRDHVVVLDGGFAAWRATVLEPAEPAPDAPEAAWDAYRQQLAVANYYLGKTDDAPVVERERVVRPVLRTPLPAGKHEGC